jgi:DNA-binding XRE family transcriptional regulator
MVKERRTKNGTKPVMPRNAANKRVPQLPDAERSLIVQGASLAAKAFRLAAKAGYSSVKVGKALLMSSSGDTTLMEETGAYLKDVRELAGLTQAELTEALHLSDQSLLAAVEKGTATLSFELILRLAALLADMTLCHLSSSSQGPTIRRSGIFSKDGVLDTYLFILRGNGSL